MLDRVDGVVWAVVGVGAIVWSEPTVRGLAVVVGVALLATGAVEMAAALTGARAIVSASAWAARYSERARHRHARWPTATTLLLALVVGVRLVVAGGVLLAALFGVRRRAMEAPTSRWRLALSVGGLALACVAVVVSVGVNSAQPNDPGAFYDAPGRPLGASGALIRREQIDPFVDGARANESST